MNRRYDLLATKAGFNAALRHFKLVNECVQSVSDGYNLADILNQDLQDGLLTIDQVVPVVNAVLYDKFEYCHVGISFAKTIDSADRIYDILCKWRALDIVLIYYDPVSAVKLVNLTEKSSLENVLPLVIHEYASLYVGGNMKNKNMLAQAAEDVAKVLNGRRAVTPKKEYLKSSRKPSSSKVPSPSKAPAQAPPPAQAEQPVAKSDSDSATPESSSAPLATSVDPSSAGYRITPKYSVLVTNELFHNGNVEAWKKIIESYTHRFPNSEVLIWYESERIKDINTLFKWGKVKNGTPIIFSVGGVDIGGVSKLQRYLFEGASPRFEAFLAGAHGQVLALF